MAGLLIDLLPAAGRPQPFDHQADPETHREKLDAACHRNIAEPNQLCIGKAKTIRLICVREEWESLLQPSCRALVLAMHVVAAIGLAACTNSNNSAGPAPLPNLMEQIRAVDLSPRATLRTNSNQRTESGSELRAATYLGDTTAQARAQSPSDD